MYFQKKTYQTPKRQVNQVIQPLRIPLLWFPQNSASRAMSKLLAEMAQPTDYPAETSNKLYMFLSHRPNTK